MHKLGESEQARQIVDILAKAATVQDGKVYWPLPYEDGHYYDKTMASTTRSTALALSAFATIVPDRELEPGIVRWLMSQRRREGWGSTNETSFAILGLTDHLLMVEAATADTRYSIDLNGQVIASGKLGRGEPAASIVVSASQAFRVVRGK